MTEGKLSKLRFFLLIAIFFSKIHLKHNVKHNFLNLLLFESHYIEITVLT